MAKSPNKKQTALAKKTSGKRKTNSVNKKASTTDNNFPIIGLGASAGGLQAFTDFFKTIPDNSGMAFVAIHHVDPDHESLMADLLAKHTKMSVVLAKDHTTVEPNHVYIIPPNYFLKIEDGTLYLTEPEARRGMRLPIDYFFNSLAEDREQGAIAIVLSGTGSDGTGGIKSIKEHGGMVLAQEPKEASHDGMPRSAVATGSVDYVLKVNKMPEAILKFAKHSYINNESAPKVLGENARGSLRNIITTLKAYSPINFGLYKEGTLLRRIERRMALKHMESSTDYLALLKDSHEEVEKLFNDLLISVTSFFRDPAAFKYLQKNVVPDLVSQHVQERPIRVWVPACASGEEAYSLAMLFIEKISSLRKDIKLQIFASDVDERALSIARSGIYPSSIEADVSPARLKRFFIKEDHTYRVTSELRDAVVFANHNILANAPFSKLDIVSCRNLMIYFNSDAQERIIHMFNFALNEGGVLFLGSSETVNNYENLFQPISKKYRLYKRIGVTRHHQFDFPITPRKFYGVSTPVPHSTENNRGLRLADVSQKFLIEHYAPAAVLINPKMNLLFAQGSADRYLRLPLGETSHDLLAMARDGLRAKLGSAIRKSIKNNEDVTVSATVSRSEQSTPVKINVHPLFVEDTPLLLVTFIDKPKTDSEPIQDYSGGDGTAYHLLEQELETTRQDLRTTIKDFEQSTEELKAANEEAMSMNEEFQSTNEELETSKEELQSLNEELTTLNTQLQQKVEDEKRTSDDLNNLLSSSGIATLFLDRQLCIMRFTPATRDLFNVLVNDIGRPFGDITGKIEDPDLLKDAKKVLDNLTPIQVDVKSKSDKWYIRNILPYVTQDSKVDGVVVTFSDVTELKRMQKANHEAQKFAESIVDTVREPLLVLDKTLNIIKASRSFYKIFGLRKSKVEGEQFFGFNDRQWDQSELRRLLEGVLPNKTTVETFEITLELKKIGRRTMLVNARQVVNDIDGSDMILLAIEDVTERNKTQRELKDREARLSAILDAVPEAVITIDENGIIGSFSPAADNILGYSEKEVIGKNVNMLMPEPDHGQHDGYLSHYVKTGEKKIIGIGRKLDALHKDGTKVPIRLTIAELWIGDKRYFTGILHDLTEENKHREELQRAQKLQAVGQLTGGIAHDFNNLLTVIIGNLEELDDQLTDKEHRSLLNEIQEASGLGAQLTRQLLAFSKQQALEPRNVSLNDLIVSMQPLLERSLGKEITIKTKLAKNLKPTLTDPGQIENALLNLAINARYAMPLGGRLKITTRNVSLDETYTATQVDVEPGDYVELAISDTGTGMSEDVLERAFEPFFSTKDPSSGSGLGLSMVYGFAKQSGGHVAIYSEVGLGTTVNLYLPPAQDSEASLNDKDKEATSDAAGETILVVEDDPRVRRLTVRRLETLDYKAISSKNGPEAIEIIKSNDDIDLVLSDIIMPGGLTGLEVAEMALIHKPELKIILSSDYADEVKIAASTHTFLRKPYSIKELAKALRDLLD